MLVTDEFSLELKIIFVCLLSFLYFHQLIPNPFPLYNLFLNYQIHESFCQV